MNVISIIKNFFKIKPKTPYQECVKTIRKLGYKKESEGFYIRDSSSGTTTIWISEDGIRIKVYSGGYAESDFWPAPLPNTKQLTRFIRQNEL